MSRKDKGKRLKVKGQRLKAGRLGSREAGRPKNRMDTFSCITTSAIRLLSPVI
jgi:hypothetical protein